MSYATFKSTTFNVNDQVTVKLTATGRQVLEQSEARELSILPEDMQAQCAGLYTKEVQDDGTFTQSMWVMMNLFGRNFHMGISMPLFENNQMTVRPSL